MPRFGPAVRPTGGGETCGMMADPMPVSAGDIAFMTPTLGSRPVGNLLNVIVLWVAAACPLWSQESGMLDQVQRHLRS
jgi:hypothetical protein